MTVNWSRIICVVVTMTMLWYIHVQDMPVRGFWCDDHSIRYPHLPMIVDYRILLLVGIAFPILIIRLLPSSPKPDNADDGEVDNSSHLARTGPATPEWDYVFGFLLKLVLTTYVKVIIARPRPNFYEICQPTVMCESFENRFISDFNCTTRAHLARNSVQSFFSGHSATGTYAGLFSALHVAAHWPVDYNLKALACSVLIMAGLFPGFTQYLNHWHHWSDVLVGQSVGLLMAVAAFKMRYWLSRTNTSSNSKNHKSKVVSQ
ncbi:hypothetical protein HA402_014815 [Bradysia odoriphaga]|nr:hypothetical protein HA402_014815 [Bradysia odoriphaga]